MFQNAINGRSTSFKTRGKPHETRGTLLLFLSTGVDDECAGLGGTTPAGHCAPGAPADTLLAIAKTESALYANAISINRPSAAARLAGYSDGQLVLTKQPKDRKEAMYWLDWFARHRYTVSIGLMQVNSEMAAKFHLKPEQLLEPCANLRVGAAILISVYTDLAYQMGEGFPALDAALSFYNSGNSITGFRNGYMASVYAHAPPRSAIFSH
jgi:type IV secretion system protein VirB1